MPDCGQWGLNDDYTSSRVCDTTRLDPIETDRLRKSLYEKEIFRDVFKRPVHPWVEPSPDPDSLPFDTSEAVTLGEWVDPTDYPIGTWFYWGEDRVSVRMVGSDRVCRVEYRQ